MKQPFLFAISGVKNSGKTTLITKLIPIFRKYGMKTAVIKHDGHDFNADVPGTDSHAYLEAGSYGTAVFSKTKYMVTKCQKNVNEQEIAAYFLEADIILLEGFKDSNYPKIELIRRGNSDQSVCSDEFVTAIATDYQKEDLQGQPDSMVFLDLNDAGSIAEFILDYWFIKTELSMVILAGGLSSRMGRDKADLIYGGKTFLECQIEKGRRLGIEEILVSGYRGERCTERVVKDRYPQKGPLGGLEAALRAVSYDYCLVIPVDMPLVSTDILKKMIREFRGTWLYGMDVPILVSKHGERVEPLLGIYNVELSVSIEQDIVRGKSSVFRFLRKTGYSVCECSAMEEEFQNINTSEMYDTLRFS